MRAVVQRVSRAQVAVSQKIVGKIGRGLLVLLGVAQADSEVDAEYLADKIVRLRIFEDQNGKMNLDAASIGAQILVVSQFTLYGDVRRGKRPSFDAAAPPKRLTVSQFIGLSYSTKSSRFSVTPAHMPASYFRPSRSIWAE